MGREGVGEGLNVRPAREADLPAIGAIQAASPEASQWPPADYLSQHCLVAESAGVLAGFLAARQVADTEWEILNLAVAPPQRRQGVAKALVSALIGGASAAFFLEVRESNTAARALYESCGFAAVTRRSQYYCDPVEAAIVMQLRS